MRYKSLLTTSNAKTSKGESLGYLTGILYLAPHTMVKGMNICKFASNGCKKACLYSAGRGAFNSVQNARIKKTEVLRDDYEYFMNSLVDSINKVIRKAKREGLKPCIRLNGTSDIRWEYYLNHDKKNIFELFPNIQFYDYTKDFKRLKALTGTWKNYHLTFSRSETNHRRCVELLDKGVNVAQVYNTIPQNDTGVIDGDLHDLRFLDKSIGYTGMIIALKSKGRAKQDQSGFVIQ